MDDYKELIEFCECYEDAESHELRKAVKAIKQLAKDNAVLTKEKDAAVGYLKKYARRCRICKHFNKKSSEIGSVCKTCKNYDENFFEDHWEWGGASE